MNDTIAKLLKRMKGKNKKDYLVWIMLGVLLLIVVFPTGKSGKKENKIEKKEAGTFENTWEKYIDNSQEKLKNILEKIDGVGQVEVMITLKNQGETILDKDKSIRDDLKEEKTVLYEVDDDTTPYITTEIMPEIEGVVVVAKGAGNYKVDAEISEAVMALFDVEVHKIKIVKMSN